MARKKAKAKQLVTLPFEPNDLEEISFNLDKQDQFITSHGVTFLHYRAMPSPIGLKDRGGYRRSETLDTISSNGMVYKRCGAFTAVMLGNSKSHTQVDGGIFDNSTSRITLPRFYDTSDEGLELGNKEIRLCVGDRIYIKDMEVDVTTYQRVEYNPNGVDLLQYPAICVEFLMDSLGTEYKQGVHFNIDSKGNIDWIDGKGNPGIDSDTGLGRVYSIRYRYCAHWVIASLINEVRVGNITDGDIRKPARMPYHAVIQREYVYHNVANNKEEQVKEDKNSRHNKEPQNENVEPNKYQIKVNINSLTEE